MATLLADSPPAQPGEQTPPDASASPPTGPPGGSAPAPEAAQRGCAKCGAPLNAGQEWCLQCGAGAPGSLGASAPGWRSTTAILGATAILAVGAAAAAYAALSKESPKAHVVTTTVAQVTLPATTPPAASTPTTTPVTPSGTASRGGAGAVKSALPLGTIKPPKIPLTATVPKTAVPRTSTPSSTSKPTAPTSTTPASTTPAVTPPGGSANGEEPQQTSILLDTNAASTYNPYNYPASNFGDPSLTIDGDPTTGWTAQVVPSTAPRMADGLLIDLKSAQKLSALTLITPTPGMTVQVYGANTHTVPASITDPAWVPLSGPLIVKKKQRIALRHPGKGFSFVTVWISKAPASAIGTEQAPAHVSINEVELFPAS